MTSEEPKPSHTSDQIMDWLEDSVSFLPSFLDDPYHSAEINGYPWWVESQDIGHDLIHTINTSVYSPSATAIATTTSPPNSTISNHLLLPNSSRKRKSVDGPIPETSQYHHNPRRNHGRQTNQAEDGNAAVEEVVAIRKPVGNKRNSAKAAGYNCNNGNNKEGRWAEQLLNPCATAITEGNCMRVQHLLYVLHELASLSGDANHRLAFHGLRALTHHLSSSGSSPSFSAPVGSVTFSSAEPRFFQKSLIKFSEVSPWFAFPNNIANSCILQLLSEENDRTRSLHILDIGVSHGVQWPILLEALSRRSGGPPPLVRITIIAGTDQNNDTPFSKGPQGDNFSTRLLCFAKSININLEINRLDNQPLQNLNAQIINSSEDETLIVCAQFRLHHLNHNTPDERTEFLKTMRKMEPKGIILSEKNIECSCSNCGNFASGFSRQVEYLWRFLESTSSAFKGRESEERRLMEGEAAKGLTNRGEMNEGKEKWCERMRGAGFVGEGLGEEAIDGGRALLRKYDSNWEMRVEEKDGFVGLWWKGQPVSFCSLWKLNVEGGHT
ncbi:protein NODULATION SIGNALING PATHWAY 1 [Humulus lupulus]|uniref:protein NODULATION SIGNALING PATHWAY 1 n=1 Tax=Humulus lupulus TaxID=3486 RepID=UPI002B40781D|nr:protein NODULATION SIGNALING PATHWAY 1 [Humulus lupulus]